MGGGFGRDRGLDPGGLWIRGDTYADHSTHSSAADQHTCTSTHKHTGSTIAHTCATDADSCSADGNAYPFCGWLCGVPHKPRDSAETGSKQEGGIG